MSEQMPPAAPVTHAELGELVQRVYRQEEAIRALLWLVLNANDSWKASLPATQEKAREVEDALDG